MHSPSSPKNLESPETSIRAKPRIHFEDEVNKKPSYNVNFSASKSRPQIKLDLSRISGNRAEVPETFSFDRDSFIDAKEGSSAKIFINSRSQLSIPETKSESARSSSSRKNLFQDIEIGRRNVLKTSASKVERTLFDSKFTSFEIPTQASHIREPIFQLSPQEQSFTENVEQSLENTTKWVEPDQVRVRESVTDLKKLLKATDLTSPDSSKLTKNFVFNTPYFSKEQPSGSEKNSPIKPDVKFSSFKEQLEKMEIIEEKIEDDDLTPMHERLSVPCKVERSAETQDTEASTNMSLMSNQLCFTPSKNSPKIMVSSDRSFTPSSNLTRFISPGKNRPSSGTKKKPLTLDVFKSRSKLKTGDFSSKMIPRHSVNKSLPPLDKKLSEASITASPATASHERLKHKL